MADIIISDDSRYMRDILREILEKHCHFVEEVADGRKMVARLAGERAEAAS